PIEVCRLRVRPFSRQVRPTCRPRPTIFYACCLAPLRQAIRKHLRARDTLSRPPMISDSYLAPQIDNAEVSIWFSGGLCECNRWIGRGFGLRDDLRPHSDHIGRAFVFMVRGLRFTYGDRELAERYRKRAAEVWS